MLRCGSVWLWCLVWCSPLLYWAFQSLLCQLIQHRPADTSAPLWEGEVERVCGRSESNTHRRTYTHTHLTPASSGFILTGVCVCWKSEGVCVYIFPIETPSKSNRSDCWMLWLLRITPLDSLLTWLSLGYEIYYLMGLDHFFMCVFGGEQWMSIQLV